MIPVASSKGIRKTEKKLKADAAKESDQRMERLETLYKERIEAMDARYQGRLKDLETFHSDRVKEADAKIG